MFSGRAFHACEVWTYVRERPQLQITLNVHCIKCNSPVITTAVTTTMKEINVQIEKNVKNVENI